MKHITLSNGSKMPALGFGTYKVSAADCPQVVQTALEIGYRHLDTAQMYHNEAGVGAGIAAAGVARDQIFLTTKLDTLIICQTTRAENSLPRSRSWAPTTWTCF